MEDGADVNEVDSNGKTPLHYCHISRYFNSSDDIDIAMILLKKGAGKSILTNCRNGFSPFKDAVYSDKPSFLEEMLNAKDRPKIDWKASEFKSIFFNCLKDDYSIKVLKLLLEDGASTLINSTDNNGDTPLHIACKMTNDKGLVRFLINNGASPSILEKNNDGLTALELAILNLSAEKSEEILDLVDVDWAQSSYNQLLNMCCKRDKWSTAINLIENGANVNINDPDVLGNTPLHYACSKSNNKNHIQALIDYGADSSIHVMNNENITPLQQAIKNQAVEELRFLLHRAKTMGIDWKEGRYKDALLFACKNRDAEFIEALLFSGADCLIDLADERGNYPIHLALNSGYGEKRARIILEYDKGRNCLKTNVDGLNAISIAAKKSSFTNIMMDIYHSKHLPPIKWSTKKGYKLFVDMVKSICDSENYIKFSNDLIKGIPTSLLTRTDAENRDNIFHVVSKSDAWGERKEGMIKLFLSYGGVKSLTNMNYSGKSPIHYAILKGHFNLAKFMIDQPERLPFNWELPEVKNLFNLIPKHIYCPREYGKYRSILNNAKTRDSKLLVAGNNHKPILYQYTVSSKPQYSQEHDPDQGSDIILKEHTSYSLT